MKLRSLVHVAWWVGGISSWLVGGGFPVAADDAPAAAPQVFTQVPEVATGQAAKPPEQAAAPRPDEGPAAQWIWGADQGKRYILRKSFAGGTRAAWMRATADNMVTIFINGRQVAANTNWQTPLDLDVQKYLKPQENVIEAEVLNREGAAGLLVKLELEAPSGEKRYILSDATWEVAESRNTTTWAQAKSLASYGAQPWGKVFSVQAAAAQAAQREVFNVLPGFQVERLFTVPKETLGSWVSITTDDRGRLIVSDQGGSGLCRVTPPPIGSQEPTKVERLNVKISSAQGLLHAFGSLYVSVNGGPGSGLYRVRDTNGDDQYDEVVKLKDFRGGGEHGPHALRLSPDGQSIYVVCGNHTRPPADLQLNAPVQTMGGPRAEQLRATWPENHSSRLMPNWDEDQLLPRQWDANGHAVGVLAPGGWVAKTDPDGKTWEIVSSGYRNQYDFALNADGELFVYDADMEWDLGSPWYRPTRVVHATSGSEFGWRSGTAKWPTYYVDSLPQVVDIGPGSPVGVEFGYGTKFPAKYQRALYLCDWTFGTMFAIHLEPQGASYRGVKEEFVSRTPLPLTDVTVGRDGALYFTIGGRGAQSELFRVTYVGDESTSPAELTDPREQELRALRRKLETYHVGTPADPSAAVAALVPHLSHADRHIRYAARVGLERLPVALWQDVVLNAASTETVITGAAALARQADAASQSAVLGALDRLDWARLSPFERLELLRAYQLAFIRLGPLSDGERGRLGEKFELLFPSPSDDENRELATLIVFLGSPNAAAKIVPLLAQEHRQEKPDLGGVLARNAGYGGTVAAVLANQPDAQQIHYAFALRNLKTGWTMPLRQEYFAWFNKAQQWSGGASYRKFLTNIDNDAFANATDAERLAIEALGARKPYVPPALPKAVGPGRDWTLDEVVALAQKGLTGRDFKNGVKTYAAARCVVCHRFAGDGGATGPDLTQLAGRFNVKDLTESMVDPSKVISDQYKASILQTSGGQTYTGRIVSESSDSLTMVVDPENASKTVTVKRSEIEELVPSTVSLMPKDLLKTLNETEVLDLLAYLLSRGNPQDPMFKK